jgi:hypothetical protein
LGFVLGVVPTGPPLPLLRLRPQGIFEESPDQRGSVREVRLMLPPLIEGWINEGVRATIILTSL